MLSNMTTLDYNTAKKLKEAGFPQTGDLMITPDGSLIQHDQTRPDKFDCYCPKCSQWEEEYCIIPTLSELIEACMEFIPERGDAMASSYERQRDETPFWVSVGGLEAEGDSYIEAVANLYLALHESEILLDNK